MKEIFHMMNSSTVTKSKNDLEVDGIRMGAFKRAHGPVR